MKKYKHFKGTIYETVEGKRNVTKMFNAIHHETKETLRIRWEGNGKFHIHDDFSPERKDFVLYFNPEAEPRVLWVREEEDFHGYKEFEDGTKVKRFELLPEEMQDKKIERKQADIQVPPNYKELVDSTLKRYKKFLKENEYLQELADNAETEEAQKEALQKNTDHFKHFFAGVISKDEHTRLSASQVKNIWERFMKGEYRDFLNAHLNLTLAEIIKIGIDKFIYVMGWKRPTEVTSWHNNRVRVGVCCHCHDQFIPMILQHNHGLCINCRQEYSISAIRKFAIRQLNTSKRYHEASQDLLMDFYIIFYNDEKFRKLFLKDSKYAKEMETYEDELPEWAKPKEVREQEGEVIEHS